MIALILLSGCAMKRGVKEDGPMRCSWQELATVGDKRSRLAGSHWAYDKHPDTPEITPRSRTTLLDVDGPGVESGVHVSRKVKESHNFRLLMPFRTHIRMEVENATDARFTGYTEVQWEKIPAAPAGRWRTTDRSIGRGFRTTRGTRRIPNH